MPVRVKIRPCCRRGFAQEPAARRRRFPALGGSDPRHSADKLFPAWGGRRASLFFASCTNAEIGRSTGGGKPAREAVRPYDNGRFEPVVRMDLAPDVNPALRQGLMERFQADRGRRVRTAQPARLPACSRSPRPGRAGSRGTTLDTITAAACPTRTPISSRPSRPATCCSIIRMTASI